MNVLKNLQIFFAQHISLKRIQIYNPTSINFYLNNSISKHSFDFIKY